MALFQMLIVVSDEVEREPIVDRKLVVVNLVGSTCFVIESFTMPSYTKITS